MDDFGKNKCGIDVVLFDFGGVIAEEGFKQGIIAIAAAHGFDETALVQAAFDATYSTGYVLGNGTESDFWNEVKNKTGLNGLDVSLWHDVYPHFVIREWMIALVKKMKTRQIKVGILSDQTDMLDKLNREHDFFKWFDHVFNSYHIGKGKRDITIFDDIAAVLKTEPCRILFIDDHPEHIYRAKQRGWHALLYADRTSF